MKKIILALLFILMANIDTHAVLKEKNLNHTLHVLRLELYNQWMRQKEIMSMNEQRSKQQHERLRKVLERSNTASLMLYSQSDSYTFDVAYACQEATTLFHELRQNTMPYDKIKQNLESEIARYDSLIYALKVIPPMLIDPQDIRKRDGNNNIMRSDSLKEVVDSLKTIKKKEVPFSLNKQAQEDRAMCIKYAETLRDNIKSTLERLSEDNEHYSHLTQRISRMNDYAQQKYNSLQQSIFINPGSNYFQILAQSPRMWNRVKRDFSQKYKPLEERKGNTSQFIKYPSEWRGPIVGFASIFMVVYIFIAAIISNILLRFLIPKRFRNESFQKKRPILIITVAIIIFSIAVMIVRNWIDHNLMLMATSLMIQMSWLMAAIYISMLIRLNDEQIVEGAKIYDPFIIMSLIVICFRIILIPNTLVNLIFPPILLIFTIWQIRRLKKSKDLVPTSDKVCCSISLGAMVVATVLSWYGFTLMAVQLLIWWMFMLAAIATIICVYDLMEMYEYKILQKRIKKEHPEMLTSEIMTKMKRGDFVSKTWIYDFFNKALVPLAAVYSILFSVFMAAEIFDLRDLCMKWFNHDFVISGPNGATIFSASASKLCLIIAMFFIFKYINYLVRSAWFGYRRSSGNSDFNATLARNVIAICTWGAYIIFCFLTLKVPATGIAVITGGLSTGLGFASKSLLENFFYGISLMSGRVQVGDYIECDNITGKVESITYQSTQLTTLDGSVVAILNSELFVKNFKNLTRNHQYVLIKIPVGVAYGTDINNVREVLTKGLSKLNVKTKDGRQMIDQKNGIKVSLSGFGDSSIDLTVLVWILVDQKLSFIANANEIIYNVLNENGIEIPFPQHDVHMKTE